VLAEEAMPLSELDRAALDQRIRNAEEDVADARDAAAKERAQETLDQLRELQTAIH
jgi:F-type H+-transporting ATPase subunit epsilon